MIDPAAQTSDDSVVPEVDESVDESDFDLDDFVNSQIALHRQALDTLVATAEALAICLDHLPTEPLPKTTQSLRDYASGVHHNAIWMALIGRSVTASPADGNLDLTIQKGPFASIINGTKTIEYRETKEYYVARLARYYDLDTGDIRPFHLRLRNGYAKGVPEVTIEVTKVVVANGLFELHLGEILEHANLKAEQRNALQARRETASQRSVAL